MKYLSDDIYYPILSNEVSPEVRSAIRLLFDCIYGLSGKKLNPTILFNDLQLNEVGGRIHINEGVNNFDVPVFGSMGVIKLGSTHHGTAGATVGGEARVYTNLVTENSRIFLTGQEGGARVGAVYVKERSIIATPAESEKTSWFTIKSTDTSDTRTVAWLIIEPV